LASVFLCASSKKYFNILFFKEKKQFIVEFRIAIKNTKECEIKYQTYRASDYIMWIASGEFWGKDDSN